MEALYLEVQPRDLTMNAHNLRANDLVIAEYYGKGVKNESFQIDYQSFRRVFRKAGLNSVVVLKHGDKEMNVLFANVQRHPVTDKFLHVDLIHIDMNVEVTNAVKLSFVGMSPAVKNLAGTLSVHLNSIDFKCLPKDLVHEMEVSIDTLVDFNSVIQVSDLVFPEGVTVLNDPDATVVQVNPPKGEATEETEEEGAAEEAAA